MMDLLRKAAEFATAVHAGQVDKSGVAYIEHPRAVAAMLDDDMGKIVAYLHDVVEDAGVSVDEVRTEFGDEVAEAVDVLTRRDGVSYMDYIRSVKKNELARRVKIADLMHNMDLSRLSEVTDEDLSRVRKYRKALAVLRD